MASLARKNLLEDIPRFLVAQAGIMFAVVLVTVQLGIFRGFLRSTALIVDKSAADLWVSSEDMVYFELTPSIPAESLFLIQDIEGVNLAEPLLLPAAQWHSEGGKIAPLKIIGFDPNGVLFKPWNVIEGDLAGLNTPYTVFIDQSNKRALDSQAVGDLAEINSLPSKIIGFTRGTQSIASSAFAFTSIESALSYSTSTFKTSMSCLSDADGNLSCDRVARRLPAEEWSQNKNNVRSLEASDGVTHILVRLDDTADLETVRAAIEANVSDVRALTPEQVAERTRFYWRDRTGIGFILGMGAGLGVVVGIVIVSQILYSSVSDHIKEFGTLKAMGASDWMLYGVIVEQSLWMAVMGYAPGTLLCFFIAQWTGSSMGIVILMTPISSLAVFGITVAMCVGSAFFAIQKVTRVDPAIVFKA
jgi:putative ABC transport system permease protein